MDAASHARNNYAMWVIAALFALLPLGASVWLSYRSVEQIPYSQFEGMLASGKITDLTIGPNELSGTVREPFSSGKTSFATGRVDEQFAQSLKDKGIVYRAAPPRSWLGDLLSWTLPALIIYGIWSFAFSRIGGGQGLGGLMAIGKSRAKVYVETDTKVTFADVAGVDEAKEELKEIVAFLKDPKSYGRLGAHAPKGILLVGPPGTGKTLIARAVAGEAGVPVFTISGPEFVELFVGVGAARVRDLFGQARAAAPCIIFIDELDALGQARGTSYLGGHDEKEQTLNQLLAELDGFDPSVGIILLAATNRPEVLDPALLRAGRFDRQILVDRPDRKGRMDILKVHVRKIRAAIDLDLDAVAGMTPGFTGADLANLLNEAALLATRRKANQVELSDITEAIERVVAGLEKKSRVLSPMERKRIARHEVGHALVAASLPGVDSVQKISIIPRGMGALGYTMQRPTEDRFLYTADDLRNRIAVLMGGRAAEALSFEGDVSTGAADDLQRATEIATEMVTRHGMVKALGHRVYAAPRQTFLGLPAPVRAEISEQTEREVDVAVRDIVESAYACAVTILESRRTDLEGIAALLLEKETLTVAECPKIGPFLSPETTAPAVA